MHTSDTPPDQIQRTFISISQEGIADIEQASMLARMGWSGAFGWDDLLKSKRVLIISEAGAGKTYECRKQQEKLWNEGEPAFFLELALLSQEDLREQLSPTEEERLDAWRASQSDVATFFLDSIDELNLTLGSFERALKRVSKAIAGQLGRARLIITSRPIPVDQQLVHKYLPIPEPVEIAPSGEAFADIAMGRSRKSGDAEDKNAPPEWRSVVLLPLTNEQIRAFAKAEGIENPDALLADIVRRDAGQYARRPQDLIELCADWREMHSTRTHRDQVERNVSIKLKPRTDRRELAQLSDEKALGGASRLALATLLTRKLTIRHSVEADRGGEPGTALDPAMILPDWTADERKTLLERSLFGFASYGRVRFHHRSVTEYLAAHRLHELHSRGMSMRALRRLLFAETPQGIKIIKPTMRPVAAWLAQCIPSIFTEVSDREPEVLFNHADPGSLTSPQRVEALRRYVTRYGHGNWRGLHVPNVQVQRFASTDLADEVERLWRGGVENHETRELLIEIMGAAPLPSCAEFAYATALCGDADLGERLEAVRTLVKLSADELSEVTCSMETEPELWPDKTVRAAIILVFPDHISPDRLCRIARRVQESPQSVGGEFRWALPHKIAEANFPPGYLMSLREGLHELMTEGLNWDEQSLRITSEHPHFATALSAVCLRLIQDGHTKGEVINSSVIALRVARDGDTNDEPTKALRMAFAHLPERLREAAFWANDSFVEDLHSHGEVWARLYEAVQHGPLELSLKQDKAWVLRALSDHERPLIEREMMLSLLIGDLRDESHDRSAYLNSLKQHVADAPDLITHIDRCLNPSPPPEHAKWKAESELRRKTAEQKEAANHEKWMAFWREVAEHPQDAFASDRAENTAWNLWQAMQRSGGESRASGWNRRFIEHYFGKDVTDRLRATMLSAWRKDRPTLRTERGEAEKNTFLIRWQFGLAALSAEAEDPEWAQKLSPDEAELAARYAPIEINGFPTWLESLAEAHPEAVERTLGPALAAELDADLEPHTFCILLQDISHAPPAVAKLFVPRLRAWLRSNSRRLRKNENEAAALSRLTRVIDVLLTYDDDAGAYVRELAAQDLATEDTAPSMLFWLSRLMRLDPAAGLEELAQRLSKVEPSADGPAIHWFAALFGDHGDLLVDLKRPGFTPALLLRLIRLAYQHICTADDISHEGVFTPGPRDNAQSARNTVLSAILNAKGPDAWAVKLEMSNDPLLAHFRDRLLLLAREKAAEEMDEATVSAAEVAKMDHREEVSPMTRDEMFTVMSDRLDDIEDLLLQDISPRELWAGAKDEKLMRREIARELTNRANGAYKVDQEGVTADEKETDIRLRATASDQQATIELKIGDGRSGRDLRDTIKDQLVSKYMAAESCRSGCLLVTVSTNKTWDHPDSGERLDVAGLAAMLDAEVTRVVDEMGASLRLSARVLDLRARLPTETGR